MLVCFMETVDCVEFANCTELLTRQKRTNHKIMHIELAMANE